MANRLTDGLPITTEWLNSLVDEIEALKGATGVSSTSSAQKPISLFGSLFSNAKSFQIIGDTFFENIPGGTSLINRTINFKNPFFDNNVIVVASATFNDTTGKPSDSYVSVGNIRSSSFEMTLKLNQTFTQTMSASVNYIAIGKSS